MLFRSISLAIAAAAALAFSAPIAQAQDAKAPTLQKINFSTKAPAAMTPIPNKEPSTAWICTTPVGGCYLPNSWGLGTPCMCFFYPVGGAPGFITAESTPPVPVAQVPTQPPI